MTPVVYICLYLFFAVFAWIVTGLVRRFAVNRLILDYPNQRSLHNVPVPRGGGISIALSVFLVLTILNYYTLLPYNIVLAIGGGGLIVVAIAWLDDVRGIAILWRLFFYLIAATWSCFCVMGFLGQSVPIMVLQYLLWILAITWMINLYNFMDGSDGLAAIQAIFAAGVSSYLLIQADQIDLGYIMLTLAASCSGFIVWNWPPARIFMGDTGSCFIGFIFGLTALITYSNNSLSPAVWLILLALFIVDATLTLLKRIIRQERWYMAHRSHAYQLVVQSGISHKQLVFSVLAVYLLVILPLSLLAFRYNEYRWEIAETTYTIIITLWLYIHYILDIRLTKDS